MTGLPERSDALLERLAVDAVLRDAAASAYAGPQFAEWLVSDAIRRKVAEQQMTSECEAETFSRLLSARVTAARMAKKYPRFALRVRNALVPGTFAQTTELAVRERCAPWVDLRVAAGAGRELWDEECDAWVELPRSVPKGTYVALTVAGDSMTPLLHDGDVIVVNPHAKLMRDSVIVAYRPEDGYVVKHVARLGRAEVELASLNPAYEPFTIVRRPALIVGTVVARLGKDR